MTDLYICGAGNPEIVRLAQRVNRACPRWDNIHLLDDDPSRRGQSILGTQVLGPFALLEGLDPDGIEIVNAVARSAQGRLRVREHLADLGLGFASLISPDVDLEGVTLRGDCVIYQQAIIGAGAILDQGSVVFMASIVGHGTHLGRCAVVAPQAVLNARVQVARAAYIGTHATILPEISIGAGATVSAGSVVMNDVPAGATVLGLPARALPVAFSGVALQT